MARTTETPQSNYGELMARAKDIIVVRSVGFLIGWDMETIMPPKGIEQRSQQLAMLSQIGHRMSTNPEIETLLSKIEKHPENDVLSDLQKRNNLLMRRYYEKQTRLPEKLVVGTARQQAIKVDVWKKAKAAKDFSMFRPELEKLLDLKKKTAQILMEVKETKTPYDVLIDIFEPKMRSERIARALLLRTPSPL